jgi:hypothetical protein
MKVLKQIWPLVFAVIFIIPAAGLSYTAHTCSMSEKTTIVLDQDYHCCGEPEPVEVKSCCAGESQDDMLADQSEDDCCSNESRYIKEQNEYTLPVKTQISEFKIIIAAIVLIQSPRDEFISNTWANANSPPLIYSSRDILLKNSLLLI